MKISIINKKLDYYTNGLINAGRKKGIEVESVTPDILDNIEKSKDLGDFIIWRDVSSGEQDDIKKNILLKRCSYKYFFNHAFLNQPMLNYEIYQQQIINSLLANHFADCNLISINTWSCDNIEQLNNLIEKGTLVLPFLKKYYSHSIGEKIEMIENINDVNEIKFNKAVIFQNYSKNKEFYKVLVLGGRVLGVTKETFNENDSDSIVSRLDNIKESDLPKNMNKISLRISTIFKLNFCEISIAYDEEKDSYFFMKVDSAPNWEDFQKTCNLNIADNIIGFCEEIEKRDTSGALELVHNYYHRYCDSLSGSKFHFFSRMYMWRGDDFYKKRLNEFKEEYIGNSRSSTEMLLRKALEQRDMKNALINEKDARMSYFDKYPMLDSYNRVLFKTLFSDFIYNYDIRSIADNLLNRDEMIRLKEDLEADKKGLAILSTYAVNYIYNLEYYLKKSSNDGFVRPEIFLDVAIDSYENSDDGFNNLTIYLLTHCIINESRFYNKKIVRDRDVYKKMLNILERIIQENYFQVSLDNKFEFLVCANIINEKTFLRDIIMSEAENSLSDLGNFLVDCNNNKIKFKGKEDLVSGEHRNVLFLMANQNYNK